MFHLENEIWSVERASIISIIQDGIAARERIRLQRLPQRDILHLLDEFGHRAAICIAFAQYAQCAPHDIPVRGQRLNPCKLSKVSRYSSAHKDSIGWSTCRSGQKPIPAPSILPMS